VQRPRRRCYTGSVLSRAFAFRPASVVERLPPRSGACPLSARDLLAAAADSGLVLPLVRAPIAGVARGALVAAKELQAVLGLALPAGTPSRPWFDAVARAADEIAAGLPLFLSADVIVEGEGGTQVERAARAAWRLVDDGLTHLAIDVAAVAVGERGRVAGEVAEAGFDRGLSVEIVVPVGEGAQVGARAAALFEEVARRGPAPDLAGVRCPAPADDDEARIQAAALARISLALSGVPVMRRGPVTPRLLELLRASPVKACEDGGAAARSALSLLPTELVGEGEEEPRRESPLERAAAELSGETVDRLEARAYVEVMDLVERLGARGGAPAVVRALERRLEDR
jgi:hypothetical protein